VGLLYRGKRERPLARAERRQLLALAVATVVGMVAWLVGVMVLTPTGRNPLSPVLMQSATPLIIAVGLFSMRHRVSAKRRRFNAALVPVLALLWLVTVVGYVINR
jgi:predicted anti-sigma-YlaC factor YlaD